MMTSIIEYMFRRALKQILKNQIVLMSTVYDIAIILSEKVDPDKADDLRRDALDMAAQYIPTDMRIKEL